MRFSDTTDAIEFSLDVWVGQPAGYCVPALFGCLLAVDGRRLVDQVGRGHAEEPGGGEVDPTRVRLHVPAEAALGEVHGAEDDRPQGKAVEEGAALQKSLAGRKFDKFVSYVLIYTQVGI